jgi:hypothetical protein
MGGEYAYVYNLGPQVVELEAPIIFDSNGPMTSGITHLVSNALIPGVNVLTSGTYEITFSVSGTEPNQFTLFNNGVPLPATTYGSGAGTQQNNGQVIAVLTAISGITLVNHTSSSRVTLAASPPIGGTAAAVNASILFKQVG